MDAGREEKYFEGMKIGNGVEALELTMSFLSGPSTINPTLLWGNGEGATLIDTGVPGMLPSIREKLQSLGLALTDITRILITHQDIDHIGSAQAIVEATGARVYAHEVDAPYIEGKKPLIKLDLARFEDRIRKLPAQQQEVVRAMLASPPRVRVDETLAGGEELPFHGGIVVVPTPGHTPGHTCYYVKEHGILIAGDALTVKDGNLEGPNPRATPDLPLAIRSLANLLPYPARAVLCYHGGLYTGDVGEVAARLRKLATVPEAA